MMRPVYIRSLVRLGAEDPAFGDILTPLEARRMGRLLKRALWCATRALEQASCPMPDGIVTATDFGCVASSEAFLEALHSGDVPRPVHFMQSTHNTIGSLVAIRLGCHGYNATYSHEGNSWRSALADAWMQVGLGEAGNLLVLWMDETSEALVKACPDAREKAVALLLGASPEGALERLDNPLNCTTLPEA